MNPDEDHSTRIGNELSVMQPGEVEICHIKRHPIGILTIYVATGLVLLIVAVMALLVAPALIPDSVAGNNQVMQVGGILFLLLAIASTLYALIATRVYWGNSWVVTSDSMTQISQTSLFNRQSSQLALVNIEDVTAEQNGILTHVFHYGVLKVETAGEHSKFQFLYCPNPNYYAKKILTAREALGQTAHPATPNQQPGPGPIADPAANNFPQY